MNANDLPLDTARIRGLQAMTPVSHAALQNWGAWSMHLKDIYPTLSPPSIWNQSKWDETEAYGDWNGAPFKLPVVPMAEPAPRREYEQLAAEILDERMHSAGGVARLHPGSLSEPRIVNQRNPENNTPTCRLSLDVSANGWKPP